MILCSLAEAKAKVIPPSSELRYIALLKQVIV